MKMRGTVACIVLSLAAVGVLGSNFYDDKENALKAVESKFEELKNLMINLAKQVENEKQKKETELEKQVNEAAGTEKRKILTKFAEEITATTKTAIAKGKPLSVIDCIMKVAFEGREAVVKVEENILKELQNIKSGKESTLKMALFQINLIGTAAMGLKDESVKKINEAKNGFQALQADAIKKIDAAKKQIEEVEARITKPDLKTEFIALKRQIEPKYQEVLATHVKKLQKC